MSDFGYGQQRPADTASQFNSLVFIIKQIVGTISVATLVQVKAVTNSGGVSPVGSVDVLPLLNQVDGLGNSTPHGVVHNLPYMRLQGGANAVILDPQVGDIGIALFADRDLSSVKASKGQANPGSRRRFNMADGLYIGGVLNGAPSQYIQFSNSGIVINAANGLTITTSAGTVQVL